MTIKHLLLAASLIALPVASVSAQTTYAQRHHVVARKSRQQSRISRGVANGQLNARETGRLEHQERGINQEERGMRAQDGGRLTAQDRHTIANQQNKESQRIYNQKHDAQTQPGVAPR